MSAAVKQKLQWHTREKKGDDGDDDDETDSPRSKTKISYPDARSVLVVPSYNSVTASARAFLSCSTGRSHVRT